MIVDIFHDTACPWCYIGKKHLFTAVERWRKQAVKIRWHAFLLEDTIPPQGLEFRSFMQARKGIGPQELQQMFDYTQRVGDAAGVELDFNRIRLAVNTTLSHQLIALTPETKKSAIVEAIYKAYFEQGLNIGDIETLVSLGASIGIDPTELRRQLSANAALDEVIADTVNARSRGINSVPLFVFNHKIVVDGSHSVAVFLQVLNRCATDHLAGKLKDFRLTILD